MGKENILLVGGKVNMLESGIVCNVDMCFKIQLGVNDVTSCFFYCLFLLLAFFYRAKIPSLLEISSV